jgi:hypothetical protein
MEGQCLVRGQARLVNYLGDSRLSGESLDYMTYDLLTMYEKLLSNQVTYTLVYKAIHISMIDLNLNDL